MFRSPFRFIAELVFAKFPFFSWRWSTSYNINEFYAFPTANFCLQNSTAQNSYSHKRIWFDVGMNYFVWFSIFIMYKTKNNLFFSFYRNCSRRNTCYKKKNQYQDNKCFSIQQGIYSPILLSNKWWNYCFFQMVFLKLTFFNWRKSVVRKHRTTEIWS